MTSFFLRYALSGKNEKPREYSFQMTPELLQKTHIINIESDHQEDFFDGYGLHERIELNFNGFNEQTEIKSITLSSKRLNTDEYTVKYHTQTYWNNELQKHIKEINNLEIIRKYELDKHDNSSVSRIKDIDERIVEHTKEIESITKDTCQIKCKTVFDIKRITLPPNKSGRMNLHIAGYSVDFYWYTSSTSVENMTETEKYVKEDIMIIPKLDHYELQKFKKQKN